MESQPNYPACMGMPQAVANCVLMSDEARLRSGSGDVDGSDSITGQLTVNLAFEPDPRLAWQFRVSDDVSNPSVSLGDLVWAEVGADRSLPLLVVSYNEFFGEEDTGVELSGIVDQNSQSAPSADAVEEVRFDVINLDASYGTLPVTDSSRIRAARHEWEFDGWRVLLDAQPDVDWRQMSARAEFGVTHVGSVTRTDGSSFSFADGHAFLECLHWFLSFVQCRRVGIALPRGFATGGDSERGVNPVVERWTIFVTDAAGSGVRGWYPSRDLRRGPPSLGSLAKAFHAKWTTGADEQQRIKFLISVLSTATAQAILVEPRLVMAFVGLEALVGETLPSKSVKMGTHLKQALQASGIPTTTDYLKNPRGLDPVNHLVAVRNAIVHSNTQLSDSQWGPSEHIVHAWKVTLWMLQQMLLRRFGYDGYCYNHMNLEIEKPPAIP